MRYLPSLKMPAAARKAFSVIAATAVILGGLSSPVFTPVASANNGLTVSANPNTGTLTPGQTLEVKVSDPSGTTDAVSDSCLVNGVNVNSTFHNVAPGDYRYEYLIGSGDTSRAAGTVPINCTLHQSVSVTITAFDDNNTVAIDTTGSSSGTGTTTGTTTGSGTGTTTSSGSGSGTGTTTSSGSGSGSTDVQPSLSLVAISPSTGTSTSGDTLHVTFTEANHQKDLILAGSCMINAVDVTNSFTNEGNGQYTVAYLIGPNDGERPAGHIPVTCTMGNTAGTVRAAAWSDGNTLAIDTNGDGTISNGTSTLGFTISADPNTGTLHVGDHLVVSFQDPLPSGDVVVGSGGCRVNDVDVAPTYTYDGNGLYKVTYTVGSGDASRTAGQVPVDCQLQNATGSVHLVNFTDGNTVAVDTSASSSSGSGSGTGTTTSSGSTGSGSGSTGSGSTGQSSISFLTEAVPNATTLTAGRQLEAHFLEQSHDNNIVLDGACRVNDVDVASSFRNVTDGQYIVYYTVGAGDPERAAGHVPVSCALRDSVTGASATVTAFTDNNTVAIDTNGDGTITEPTGAGVAFVSSVSASPSSGTLGVGSQLAATIRVGNDDTGSFTPTSCTMNGKDVASTFQNLGSSLYKLTYTVASGDQSQAAGHVPIDCTLRDSSGQTVSTLSSFTDGNTVAIDASGSTSGSGTGTTTSSGGSGSTDTGGSGTTTSTTTQGQIGGSVTGGTDSSNGGNGFLHVDSIEQVRSTAVAGGGFDQGWEWIFHITVPSNEQSLRMKFDDWTHSNGTTKLGVSNDMRISSDQADSATPVVITGSGQLSDTLHLVNDKDAGTAGRQVDVKVDMQVPLGTLNGVYTTNYGVDTQ